MFCLDDRFIGKPTSVKKIGKTFDTHMRMTVQPLPAPDAGILHMLCMENARRKSEANAEAQKLLQSDAPEEIKELVFDQLNQSNAEEAKRVRDALGRIKVASADLEINPADLPWLLAYSETLDMEEEDDA